MLTSTIYYHIFVHTCSAPCYTTEKVLVVGGILQCVHERFRWGCHIFHAFVPCQPTDGVGGLWEQIVCLSFAKVVDAAQPVRG